MGAAVARSDPAGPGATPADLAGGAVQRVLQTILPVLQSRWQARQRPLPPAVAWAKAHFTAVLIADGSTLDGLLRKIGLLRTR